MHNNNVCYICVVLDILNYLEMIQNVCGGWVFVKTTLFHKWDLGICRESRSQPSVGTEGWLYCAVLKKKT